MNLYTADLNRSGRRVLLTEEDLSILSPHDRDVLYSNITAHETPEDAVKTVRPLALAEAVACAKMPDAPEHERADLVQSLTREHSAAELRRLALDAMQTAA